MSTASASRTVTFLRRSCSYMTSIVSSSGDLWQEYVGEANSNATVRPSFKTLQPIIEFVCISSRVATGEVSVGTANIAWYFNGNKIEFESTATNGWYVSTGTYAGYFKKGTSNGRQALQIVNELVFLSNYSSCTIKAIAEITDGTSTDSLQATYTIGIQQASGSAYKVTIAAGDSKNFVINEKSGSCILKCMTYKEGTLFSTNLTYQWYKFEDGDWSAISGATSQTYTVTEASIDTYAEYMCVVKLSGNEIGRDTQGVMDATDPYLIYPNPDPLDETITEGTSGTVEYTPSVVNRSSGKAVSPQPSFTFTVMDAAGTKLKNSSTLASGAAFSVTEALCTQAGGDVSLMIVSGDI